METKYVNFFDKIKRECGKRLKKERIRLGLNQAEFADRLGVHRNTQRNYENGSREPDSDYYKAAGSIGVNLPYVISGTNINDLPSYASQIASLVFNKYKAGFNCQAMGDLFFLLGLSKKNSEIEVSGYVLSDDYIDALIRFAIERGEVFHEAFDATSYYANDLICSEDNGLDDVCLWVEMIFETIHLYDEFKDKLSGLNIHDAVRLSADGVVKNHRGKQINR